MTRSLSRDYSREKSNLSSNNSLGPAATCLVDKIAETRDEQVHFEALRVSFWSRTADIKETSGLLIFIPLHGFRVFELQHQNLRLLTKDGDRIPRLFASVQRTINKHLTQAKMSDLTKTSKARKKFDIHGFKIASPERERADGALETFMASRSFEF